ncbi:hypothetical protein SDC9_92968 [bioreactor metagenome]|uniref:Uncharacterized protein n=1 Tax=bioreactor metagenome TaxID=1076179 RepID=A0A644ZZ79_9ZZZZ
MKDLFECDLLAITQHAQVKEPTCTPDRKDGQCPQKTNGEADLPEGNGGKHSPQRQGDRRSKREHAHPHSKRAVEVEHDGGDEPEGHHNGQGEQASDLLSFAYLRGGCADGAHGCGDHNEGRQEGADHNEHKGWLDLDGLADG